LTKINEQLIVDFKIKHYQSNKKMVLSFISGQVSMRHNCESISCSLSNTNANAFCKKTW